MNEPLKLQVPDSTIRSQSSNTPLEQLQTPALRTSYAAAHKVALTPQETAFVSAVEDEHTRLGRTPTARELQLALTGTPLDGLSKDRLAQIRRNLNARIPHGAEPLVLTKDRPVFRHLELVRAAYERYVKLHKQPPSFSQLKDIVSKTGSPITKTSHT